ncbi:YIP1 family protein [Salinithrix halophila]|uniref:YIP1 family protein n=1 Tax=Salinithrix halophila TaxID=1485204 RepID=A0ABV8JF02_9BACL
MQDSQETHPPETTVTAVPKPSLLGVLTDPTTQFQRIAKRPVFGKALFIILVLSMIFSGISIYITVPNPIGVLAVIPGVLIGFPLTLLLTALLQWLFLLLLAGEASYRQVFSFNVYLSVVALLAAAVQAVALIIMGAPTDPEAPARVTSLVSLFPTESQAMRALLGKFEVFSIWQWILTGMGLSIVGNVSRAKGWAVAIVLFVLGVAYAAGMGALGDSLKGIVPAQ